MSDNTPGSTVCLQWETDEDPASAHWSGLDSRQTTDLVAWIRGRFGTEPHIETVLPPGITGMEIGLPGQYSLVLAMKVEHLDEVSAWLTENIGQPDGVR